MKKIISVLLCIAMLISMAIVPASAETYGKNWEFESGVEGWFAQNSTLSGVGGNLVQTITTAKSNTFLLSPSNLNIDASVYKYLKVRVKNSTTANGFFRFEATNNTKTSFAGSWTNINGNINPADGEWHEYCIDLSQLGTDWSGTVSRLRLCMSTWTTEGTIEYDYIRFSDTADVEDEEEEEAGVIWSFDGSVLGFSSNNSTATSVGGCLVQTITTEKNNTWLQSPSGLNIDASIYKYLKVRVKNSTTAAGLFRFEAIGTNKAAFTGSWVALEDGVTPNDGKWHEYIVDLSKYGTEWSGTISRFRLCMSAWNCEGTVEFDYIKLSDYDVKPEDLYKVNLEGVSNPGDVPAGSTVDLSVTTEAGVPSEVEYFVNGTSIGTATEAPFAMDWTPTQTGEYYIKAIGTFPEKKVLSEEAYVNVYDGTIIEKSAYYWQFNEGVEDFKANQSTLTAENGCLIQTVAKATNNSFLITPEGLDIDADKYKYIKLRVKADYATNDGQFAIQWVTDDAPSYDTSWSTGAKTIKIGDKAIPKDGKFHDYVVDLSGHEGWTGNISQLRIKVTSWSDANAEMNAYVDYIRISNKAGNGIDESDIPAKYEIEEPKYLDGYIYTSTLLNDDGDGVNETEDIVYVAAKYDNDNRLVAVKLAPLTLAEGEEDTTPIDVSELLITDSERVDVMVMSSMNRPEPIADKVTVYDNGVSANHAKFAGAFMDHMLLQRDMPVNVWGTAEGADGSVLEISFAGHTVVAEVNNGEWKTTLPALEASADPQTLTLRSCDGVTELTDILVGDVYLVGGQSNASFGLNGTDTWAEDRAGAVAEDNIRILFSARANSVNAYSETKRKDPYEKDVWQAAVDISEEEAGWDKYGYTMINCPAFAYYFADTLRADGVDVPIGLVAFAKSGATLAMIMPAEYSDGIVDARKGQVYNGLLAPVENMTAKGMLWYQGESDTNDTLSPTYTDRFSQFVDYMREKTGNSEMPVFMVQLSSHSNEATGTASSWKLGRFRSIQTDMILNESIDGLYMVASLDKGWKIGDSDMAHPRYKKPVGQRLAKLVENVFYDGENVLAPLPTEVEYSEGKCVVTFDVELTEDEAVKGFELICDGVAYAATAKAYENKVEIVAAEFDGVADGVRYAFYNAASPLAASLKGANGLYAPTFALDNPDAEVEVAARLVAPISLGIAEESAQ